MKSKSNKNLGPVTKFLNNPVFKNKFVLYFVAILVFIQLLTYLLNSKFSAIVFFYIVSLITYKFNKNMAIVLGVPAILTFVINNFMYRSTVEGLENKEDSEESVEIEESPDDDDPIDTEEMVDEESIEENSAEKINELKKLQVTDKQIQDLLRKTIDDEEKPKKSGYKNMKKNPGLYTLPNKDDIKKQMKKADKIEEAYDNLEKVIGKDGIKSISSNTKELVEQQKELISGLKDITPALDQAMGALSKVDMSKIMGIFNSFSPK